MRTRCGSAFDNLEPHKSETLAGQVKMVTFGSAQYQWHPGGVTGKADPDGPPARSTISASPGNAVRAACRVDHGVDRNRGFDKVTRKARPERLIARGKFIFAQLLQRTWPPARPE